MRSHSIKVLKVTNSWHDPKSEVCKVEMRKCPSGDCKEALKPKWLVAKHYSPHKCRSYRSWSRSSPCLGFGKCKSRRWRSHNCSNLGTRIVSLNLGWWLHSHREAQWSPPEKYSKNNSKSRSMSGLTPKWSRSQNSTRVDQQSRQVSRRNYWSPRPPSSQAFSLEQT